MKISEIIAAQNRAKTNKLPEDYVPLPETTVKEMFKIVNTETDNLVVDARAVLVSKFGDAVWIKSDRYKTSDGVNFVRNLLVKDDLREVLDTIPDGSEVVVSIDKSTVVAITQYVP